MKKATVLFFILIIASLALSACGPAQLGTEKNHLGSGSFR